jgi:hypothetical protein
MPDCAERTDPDVSAAKDFWFWTVILDGFIGLTEVDAVQLATEYGIRVRVIQRDHCPTRHKRDHDGYRLSLTVEHDTVTHAVYG